MGRIGFGQKYSQDKAESQKKRENTIMENKTMNREDQIRELIDLLVSARRQSIGNMCPVAMFGIERGKDATCDDCRACTEAVFEKLRADLRKEYSV